jgi:hypothetical protein
MSDSDLVLFAREHLGTCFEICIKQFSSHKFPIRNCAAMLFSTLINKAFGTKKTSSEGEKTNLVFGRDFFLKFPRLYSLFLEQLKTAVCVINQNQVHPILYPLLSVFSRLKPFGNETENTLYSLRPFETLVLKCAKAVQWKAREISARTVGSLVNSTRVLHVIEEIASRNSKNSTNCFLHGSLLQIEALLYHHFDDCIEEESSFVSKLNLVLSSFLPLLAVQRFSVARYVFLRIVQDYRMHIDHILIQKTQNIAVGVFFGNLSTKFCPDYIHTVVCHLACADIRFLKMIPSVLHIPENFLIPLLQSLARRDPTEIQELSLVTSIIVYCNFLTTQLTTNPRLFEASLRFMLAVKKISDIDVNHLFAWLHKPSIPYSLVCVLLESVSILIRENDDWSPLLSRCLHYSQPQLPIETRVKVSECLFSLKEYVNVAHQSFVQYAMLLDQLVQDNDEGVRLVAVKAMSFFIQDTIIQYDTYTRNRFLHFLCKECVSAEEVANAILDKLEKIRIDTTKDIYEQALFDTENLNTFQESVVDIFIFSECLFRLSTRILNRDQMVARCTETVQEFLELSNLSDFSWLTNSVHVFELGLFAIACAHLLVSLGYHDSLLPFSKLKMHPFLMRVLDKKDWNRMQTFFVSQ